MKIHVTGASGFVGQNVIRLAKEHGHEVVALVREHKTALEGVEQILVGDIATRSDWTKAVEGADAVVHLAARVHVMNDTAEDIEAEYARVNTAPTVRLAEAAQAAGVKRFVFMSSIKVNGERTGSHPFSVDSNPEPVDPYGLSKLHAEVALEELSNETGLAVTVLRPTVVYGPGAGGNIARIGRAVRRGVPLPFGSVRNARTMLAVENLSIGTVAAAESQRAGYEAFLLGDVNPVSTRRLVELLAQGSSVVPRLINIPVGALKIAGKLTGRSADIGRLVENLEIVPQWAELGVEPANLLTTDQAMFALGRFLASEGARS